MTGGVVLLPKPEDFPMWQAILKRADRLQDSAVLGPGYDGRWNFLDYVLKTGGSTREITTCLMMIGECLQNASDSGGEHKAFWRPQEERMIFNAVQVVKLATGKVDAWDLQRFVNGAAQTPEQLKSSEWRRGFHGEMIRKAIEAPMSEMDTHDLELALEYELGELPTMADKTKSSILTGVNGTLHVFNSGIVRELVSTTTNVTPEDTFAGKFLLVNAAPWSTGTPVVS